jgi:NTE family protein
MKDARSQADHHHHDHHDSQHARVRLTKTGQLREGKKGGSMPNRRSALHAFGLAAGTALLRTGARAQARRRVGIALGSGGMHGLVHIGVVRAFQRLGVRPAVIAGCSSGAIAGALWAAGKRADEIAILAMDTSWREFDRLRLPRFGLGDLTRLQSLIDRSTNSARIEDLATPFAAVATDLVSGEARELRSGPLGRAVAASASVPIRFEPVMVDGRYLVDGALTAPLPVDAARASGADIVISVDVAYRPYEDVVTGIAGVAFQMFHIMVNRLIAEQARRADHAIRLDVHALMKNNDDPHVLIEYGERAVLDQWPALAALLVT